MKKFKKLKKLIIVGAGETAEMAYEYFTYDSEYEVAALSVDSDHISSEKLFGLEVVPFEYLESKYPPEEYYAFVAMGYGKLNRVRTKFYDACKEKGYTLASYISSRAFVWRNVEIGDNCFILENNVLQYCVKIGNNVVLWSGNHIGHRTEISDNCFLSSHVVISGYCKVGKNCFFGVNSCVGDTLKIESDCVIGAGATLLKSTGKGKIYRGNPAVPENITSYRFFNVK